VNITKSLCTHKWETFNVFSLDGAPYNDDICLRCGKVRRFGYAHLGGSVYEWENLKDYRTFMNMSGEKKQKQGWWIKQLIPLIDEYKDGDKDPLDGDEVDALCDIIKAKINLHQGNITEKEFRAMKLYVVEE